MPALCVMLFCCTALHAQQSSNVLPSLINNEKKTEEDSLSDIAMLKKKMFVKVITSKSSLFVGEPVLVTYKFYALTRLNDNPTVYKYPEFSGCSVKQLEFEQGPEFENINNELYAIYTIRKVQLTALQPGTLSLGKAVVNNVVLIASSKDAFISKKYVVDVANEDASVDVKDLPQTGKPQNFYGITGVFTISAAAKNNTLPMGESGHLIIKIKGWGNFDAIAKPEVDWPAGIEHFDGTDSQRISQDNFPVTAEHIFDIPFIGRQEGAMHICPVHFSFFNTETEQYETVSTDSIQLSFTKTPGKKYDFSEATDYDVTNRRYLWIVPAIALVVASIGFISYKKNKKKEALKQAAISVTPAPVFAAPQTTFRVKYRTDFSNHLSQLEGITEHKPFFAKAKDILTKAVAERVDSTAQNSEQVLMQELKQRTYNAPVSNKAAALLQAINVHLYAPFETEADLPFYYNELKQVVDVLQAES